MQAFVFPGQGSQAVGMGRALADAFPVAKAVFAEVDEALGEALAHTIFEGPTEALTLTANAQPALMAVSLAAIRVLEAEAGLDLRTQAAFVAGHSLGEYSALAAADTFSLADAARLLRLRGSAMQKAVPVGAGAMAALLGIERKAADLVAAQATRDTGEPCEVANDNGGGQIVVSGARVSVERAMIVAKDHGVRRALHLPVSAPFHCSLMAPAAAAMQEALAGVTMRAPCVPLVANMTAEPVSDPDAIRDLLIKQVTGTVRWRESMRFMADAGVTLFVECGAGKVLSGLAKRIAEGANGIAVGAPDDIAAFKAAMQPTAA